jgi:hypothetical protein
MQPATEDAVHRLATGLSRNYPVEVVDAGMAQSLRADTWSEIPGSFQRRYCGFAPGEKFSLEEIPRYDAPQYPVDCRRIRSSRSRMAHVESDCKALLAAAKQWGGIDASYVDWMFVDVLPTYLSYLGGSFDFAYDLLWWSIEAYGLTDENIESVPWYIPPKSLPHLAFKALRSCFGWEFAVEKDIPIRGLPYTLPQRDVSSYSELENPFVPLVSIMEHGCYVIDLPTEKQPSIRVAIAR